MSESVSSRYDFMTSRVTLNVHASSILAGFCDIRGIRNSTGAMHTLHRLLSAHRCARKLLSLNLSCKFYGRPNCDGGFIQSKLSAVVTR